MGIRLKGAHLALAGCALGLGLSPDALHAGGFYVPQQTIQGIGRAFAGDAAGTDDPSTIFSNPAGMTLLDGAQTSLGVSIIKPTIKFQDRGSTAATPFTLGMPVPVGGGDGGDPGHWQPVPNFYAAGPTDIKNLWVGLGITAPFGLTLRYDPSWFGRYDSIETNLITIDVAPSVAYRINDYISIGGGFDLQYAEAKLTSALPNPLSPGGPTAATDGLLSLNANSFAPGFNVGIMVQPTTSTRIGLSYRSAVTQHLGGTGMIRGFTGPLASQNQSAPISADLKLPDFLSLGFSQWLTPRLTLLGEVQWFDWSRFDQIAVTSGDPALDGVLPEHYQDSYTAALGAEYRWTDDLTVRGAFEFDQTPTVDAFRNTSLPDGNRYWLTIGASYRLGRNASIDAAYAHVFFNDGPVDVTRNFYPGLAPSSTTTNGVAETSVDTLSVSFRYRF
jgi:long-chain fatty acid transport protein